jgi:hypothetical protein
MSAGSPGIAAGAGGLGIELEFAAGKGRSRAGLAECAGARFEEAMPVRPFRWSRGQEHFPG